MHFFFVAKKVWYSIWGKTEQKNIKAYRGHIGLSLSGLSENEREYKVDMRGSDPSLI